MKKRIELKPGYKTFNGKVLTRADCDYYNRSQRDINRWIDAEREVPVSLLNQSHHAFNMICGMFN